MRYERERERRKTFDEKEANEQRPNVRPSEDLIGNGV